MLIKLVGHPLPCQCSVQQTQAAVEFAVRLNLHARRPYLLMEVCYFLQVPLPPVDEKKKVIEDVDKDRRYAIDAAIVRTMKSRKVLQHQQLVLEVVQQLSRMFKPDFKLIKKRIEDLIAREYLERDKDNPQLFKYLA